jgi:hypothetical protein
MGLRPICLDDPARFFFCPTHLDVLTESAELLMPMLLDIGEHTVAGTLELYPNQHTSREHHYAIRHPLQHIRNELHTPPSGIPRKPDESRFDVPLQNQTATPPEILKILCTAFSI